MSGVEWHKYSCYNLCPTAIFPDLEEFSAEQVFSEDCKEKHLYGFQIFNVDSSCVSVTL